MRRVILPAMLIAVAVAGTGAQANPVKSLYTTIDLKECKQVKRHRDGNAWECLGLPGFPVYIAEGDLRHFVSVGVSPQTRRAAKQTLGPFNSIFEAGSNRAGGWAWVTGEPLGDYAPWLGVEPNAGTEGGEDAVALEYGGRWGDWPIGEGAEQEQQHPFLIEWDTALPAPVPGVRTIGRVLPEKWPVDLLAGTDSRSGEGPWTICMLDELNNHRIREMVTDFLPSFKLDIHRYGMARLNYRLPEPQACAGGWIEVTDSPKHP